VAGLVQAVFDELCSMLDGGDPKKTELKKGKPNVVMFVGLQGAQCLPGRRGSLLFWRHESRTGHGATGQGTASQALAGPPHPQKGTFVVQGSVGQSGWLDPSGLRGARAKKVAWHALALAGAG
jgi:hypothetical protein